MEPPAKRARHGRAPHDDFSDFSMPMDYNSKRTGPGGKKGDGSDGQDDEDEIAMDPEDYAMKLNPQLRLEKSRAVADNKLKSALELLFEKYSRDFGDTGDEINFYTDEIEVDNGHISSFIAQGGDDDDGDDDEEEDNDGDSAKSALRRKAPKGHHRTAEELARGLSLLSSGPAFRGRESRSMGEGMMEPRPVVLAEEPVDPTWAAPELPDTAFSTPRPPGYVMQPPRISYSVPHRSIIRKSLPESFGTPSGTAVGERTEEGGDRGGQRRDDNGDDLVMDSSEPILKFSHGEDTPRRKIANWTGPSPNKVLTESPSLPPPSSVLSTITQPDGRAPAPHPTGTSPTRTDAAAKSISNHNTETFSRNTLDPSFAFSDDEDLGLKRRNKPPKSASWSATTTSTEQPPNGMRTVYIMLDLPRSTATTPTTPTVQPSVETPTTEKTRAQGQPRTTRPVSGKRPVGRPRKIREPDNSSPANRGTSTPQSVSNAKAADSLRPLPAASSPPTPPSQDSLLLEEPQPPHPIPDPPQKRRAGRPKMIREPENTHDLASTPAGQEAVDAQEQEPPSSPPATSAASTPSKQPLQDVPQHLSHSEPQPRQKRRVGRPRKTKDPEDDGKRKLGSSPHPAPAPSQVLSPPLWESVSQLQQKRRVGRPKKAVANNHSTPRKPSASRQNAEAAPDSDAAPLQPQSQSLPRISRQSRQSRQPNPSSPLKPGRAEVPDSQDTNASSSSTTARRAFTLRSSMRSEIPDSESNLGSSIITLVSDGEDEAEDADGGGNDNESGYDVQATISSQLAGLGGSRLSPARSVAATPQTISRFVVIPRSNTGSSPVGQGGGRSGRASPLARLVLRTPSPVKFMPSRLASASKLLVASRRADGEVVSLDGAEAAHVPSPSGSVVQTPGGTMRRCGQDGFRCEREFCFKCA